MSASVTYPVIWKDTRYCASTSGVLALLNKHAVLTGTSSSEQRLTEFDASEVETVQMVPFADRLDGRPTLEIGLHGRGKILVAQLIGFGAVTEVIDVLTAWLSSV